MNNINYNKWLKIGLEKGLDDLEFKIVKSENLSLSVYNNELEKNEISNMTYLIIKGLINNKSGIIKLEDLSENNINKSLDKLILSIKYVTSSEPELIYEGDLEYTKVENLNFDFNSIETNDKINLLFDIEKGIKKEKKLEKISDISYSETKYSLNIINTKGLNLERKYSVASIYAYAVYSSNKSNKTSLSYQVVTNFNDFNKELIINNNIKEGLLQLDANTIKSGKYPVVFSNEQFGEILSAFSNIFSGLAKLRNLTKLTNLENTKIANSIVNLVDDPFDDKALIKINFDDEGVKAKKHYLIKDGIFNSFIHNLKTAKIYNEKPTGHGFSNGISNNNLLLEPGEYNLDEVFKTINYGIYIKDLIGLHAGVEQVSGNFSLQASGLLIEEGKLTKPVDMIVISGNFYELLNNIEMIANDFIYGLSGVGSSSVKVSELTVAGK